MNQRRGVTARLPRRMRGPGQHSALSTWRAHSPRHVLVGRAVAVVAHVYPILHTDDKTPPSDDANPPETAGSSHPDSTPQILVMSTMSEHMHISVSLTPYIHSDCKHTKLGIPSNEQASE